MSAHSLTDECPPFTFNYSTLCCPQYPLNMHWGWSHPTKKNWIKGNEKYFLKMIFQLQVIFQVHQNTWQLSSTSGNQIIRDGLSICFKFFDFIPNFNTPFRSMKRTSNGWLGSNDDELTVVTGAGTLETLQHSSITTSSLSTLNPPENDAENKI